MQSTAPGAARRPAEVEHLQDHAEQASRLVANRVRGAPRPLTRRRITLDAHRLQLDRSYAVLQIVNEESRDLFLVQLKALQRIALALGLLV